MKDLDKPIKKIIQSKYNINTFNNLKILGNNENLVFLLGNKVFRVTKFSHRSKKEILEETNLLEILYKNKGQVVKIIQSDLGNNFETDVENKIFITCFEFADGKIIDINTHENKNEIMRIWGKSMGRIHKIISENFENINYNNRLVWDEEIIIKNANNLLDKEDYKIFNILDELKKRVKKLPKKIENYGFVHTDMRPRNFHYENGKIIHFDFDDISSNWFVYDISVSLLHELEGFSDIHTRTLYANNFLEYFLKGYIAEKKLKKDDMKEFITFMHIRLIYAYIDYFKRLKIKNIDSGKEKMLMRKKFIGNFEEFINFQSIESTIYSIIK